MPPPTGTPILGAHWPPRGKRPRPAASLPPALQRKREEEQRRRDISRESAALQQQQHARLSPRVKEGKAAAAEAEDAMLAAPAAPGGALSEAWLDKMLASRDGAGDVPQLAAAGLDRKALMREGLSREESDRVYRAMYVYSVGFHNCVAEATRGTTRAKPHLLASIWRVYSELLERSGAFECRGGMAAVELQHREALEKVKLAHQAELDAHNERLARAEEARVEVARQRDDVRSELEEERALTTRLKQDITSKEATIEQLMWDNKELGEVAELAKRSKAKMVEKLKTEALGTAELHRTMRGVRSQLQDASGALKRSQDVQRENVMLIGQLKVEAADLKLKLQQETELRCATEGKLRETETAKSETLGHLHRAQRDLAALTKRYEDQSDEMRTVRSERNKAVRCNADLERERDSARAQLEDQIGEHAKARKELLEQRAKLNTTERKLHFLATEYTTLKEQNASLRKQVESLARSKEEMRDDVQRAGRDAERLEKELDIVMGQYESECALRESLHEKLTKRLVELTAQDEELKKVKRLCADKHQALLESRTKLGLLENKLDEERADQAEREAAHRREIADLTGQLAAAHTDLEARDTQIADVVANGRATEEDLRRALDRIKAFESRIAGQGSVEARMADLRASAAEAEHDLRKAETIVDTLAEDVARLASLVSPDKAKKVRAAEDYALEEAVEISRAEGRKRKPSEALIKLHSRRTMLKEVENDILKVTDLLKMEVASRKSVEAAREIEIKQAVMEKTKELHDELVSQRSEIQTLEEEQQRLMGQLLEKDLDLQARSGEAQSLVACRDERVNMALQDLEGRSLQLAHTRDELAHLMHEHELVAKSYDELVESMGTEMEQTSSLMEHNSELKSQLARLQELCSEKGIKIDG